MDREEILETRKIGSLEVSVVGIGCNNMGRRIDAEGTAAVVNAALDAGINFFDTADIYAQGKSEELLGKALGERRKRVIVATKFGMELDAQHKGAHPDYIRSAVEDSLKRLGTDYIDLYQLHRPDPTVPIADTLGALDDLVKAGKVREIGCSQFSPEQIAEAEAAVKQGAARFISVQNEYSLLHREPELGVLDECERRGLAFIPFFPLASGLLTGKYRVGQPLPTDTRLSSTAIDQHRLDLAEALATYAEAHGHTLLELAFSWLLAHKPVASVIAGAMRPEQVQANAAATNWALTEAEMGEVDAILGQPA